MEVLIGIVSGMVTAIGMGGGTILILFLTLFLKVPQTTAQAANLIFFIPTSITAIILNIKNKNIDLKVGLPIIGSGVIGSLVGAILSNRINIINLKKIFGVFLLVIAIHEIYNFYNVYIKKKNTNNNKKYKIYKI